MSAEMMFGKPIVDDMVAYNNALNIDAGLATIQVGNNPQSTSYITQVHKSAPRLSRLHYEHYQLPEDTRLQQLFEVIDHLNRDEKISGMMLQVPLPTEHFHRDNFHTVRNYIAPKKDLDVQGNWQRGEFFTEKKQVAERKTQLVPPTPYAVMKMLQFYNIDVRGKVVAIVGCGTVGKPLSIMMMHDLALPQTFNETAVDLGGYLKNSDIIVSTVGSPHLITGEMIKPGAAVINVGMTEGPDGKWIGDVDVESVKEVAAHVTPTMGGLGPVTVMALIQNAFRAALAERKS